MSFRNSLRRDRCYSQREKRSVSKQSAFNVHNSSAANLRAAKHNNFIFSSSGHKTRAEKVQGDRWQNRRHVSTAFDRFVRYSEILSGLLQARYVNQNRTGDIRKRRLYKSGHNEPLRVGIKMNVSQPWGLLACVRRHSVPIGHEWRTGASLGTR